MNGRRAIVHELDFRARGNDERGWPGKAGDKVGWSGRQAEICCRHSVDKCKSPLEGSWLCRTVGLRSLLTGRGGIWRGWIGIFQDRSDAVLCLTARRRIEEEGWNRGRSGIRMDWGELRLKHTAFHYPTKGAINHCAAFPRPATKKKAWL